MNEARIRKLRIWRTTGIATAIVEAGLFLFLILTAAWIDALIPGAIMLIYAAVVVRNTVKIREIQATEARSASRVDWTSVRIMEHEVYGRIFHHDGAPGISGTDAEVPGRDPRAVWCDCHGTIQGHIRAPRHYDPRYGYPAEDAPERQHDPY